MMSIVRVKIDGSWYLKQVIFGLHYRYAFTLPYLTGTYISDKVICLQGLLSGFSSIFSLSSASSSTVLRTITLVVKEAFIFHY